MRSMIKKYQLSSRKSYIQDQTASAIKNAEFLSRQINHLDKYVDLSPKIVVPYCEMLETKNELNELLSKSPSEKKLDEAQSLGFMLEAQVSTIRQSVEEVLSQGIEFLRLPEFDEIQTEQIQEDEDEPEA